MRNLSTLWLLAFQPVVRACVEMHSYLNSEPFGQDSYAMQVWYNGRLVCSGSAAVGFLAGNSTVFSLRNSDGKGWNGDPKGSGCEPGYSAFVFGNSHFGNFTDHKNNRVYDLVTRVTQKQTPNCGTAPGKDNDYPVTCSTYESCLYDNNGCGVPTACNLCDFKAKCSASDTIGSEKPVAAPGFKAMIVGDSITQGDEGDWTWRYRLWEWLRQQRVSGVDFVGPYTGTQPPLPASPPTPPPLDGEVRDTTRPTTGKYAVGVDGNWFSAADNTHFARWGYPMAFAKNTVAQQLKAYPADYLLLMLGFNDLGWFYNDPDGLLRDAKATVDAARSVNGNIRILLANVVHRKDLSSRPDLAPMIDKYNGLLANAVSGWNTQGSPVVLVDVNKEYNCKPGGCPSGYDGLHPNAQGEYEIARAFSKSLVFSLGIGKSVLELPASPPSRPNPIPSGVKATATRYSVSIEWTPVFGAHQYEIYMQNYATNEVSQFKIGSPRWDNTWVATGWNFDFKVRTIMGDDASLASGWSNTVSVKANLNAAPGPKNIRTTSIAGGFSLTWDAVPGWNIERYGIYAFEMDAPGAFPQQHGARGTSYTFRGLTPGRKYIVAIESWGVNVGGPGFPANGPDTMANKRGLHARNETIQAAETWDGSTLSMLFDMRLDAMNGTFEVVPGIDNAIGEAGLL